MAIIWERRDLCRGVLILAVSLLIPFGVLRAETLPELVQYLAQEHNLVKAAEQDVNAARQRARVALGDWFPTLDVSTSYGFEDQVQPGAADTRFVTRDLDLKVTQLLWDFGKTNASLRRAGLVLEQTLAVLDGVRQNILLRGVTAYLNVSRRTQVLEFARRSESNIKKQADLENALVQAGKGFSTDVLQAKARLAGAEARRIDAHGRFERAKNDFRALFERTPDNIYSQGIVHLPIESLPLTLEDAVETAIQFNPVLKSESFAIKIAQEDVNSTRSDSFFPRLQGVVEQRYKKDFSGTVGFQRESLGKVELSFPFNLGFTSVNKLRAAKHDRSATVRRVADRKDLVEQQTRDAWTNLLTARQRTTSLRNQAEIVMRFLEDARKERKAGRRSLLDVLDGETQLLNAQSDAASAEIDSAIAIFTLFEAMGQLTESVILGRKSGEYLPEPRLSLDFGKLRNGGIKTRAVQKIAPPSNKEPEFVFPLLHKDPADEEPNVEARHQADKETVSDLAASERKPKQNPEADSGRSGPEQTEALRAENKPEEPEPPTADSESTVFDLLAGIRRFFQSTGGPEETIEPEPVKAVVAELEASPETSPETNGASEQERSLTADPADASPEQDQAPEADSGLSGPEQAEALRAENELEEPAPGAADSQSTLYDLLAGIGQFFQSTGDPEETIEPEPVKAVVAELEASPETSPKTNGESEQERSLTADPANASPEQDQAPEADSGRSGPEQAEDLRAENESEEPAPGAADSQSTLYDLLAGIGRFFESAGDLGETIESELVETETVEPPALLQVAEAETPPPISEASEPAEPNAAPNRDQSESAEIAPVGTTEPKPPTADSESTLYDLLAGIGRFFESAGDLGETDEPESVKAVVVELEAPPETSPETKGVPEQEISLTADPADASPEQDQAAEADSGLSGPDQIAALRAENEPEEPAPLFADLESTIYDLLARIGRFFESAGNPGDTAKYESVKAVVVELEAPPETSPEISVVSEKEISLTADPADASPEPDQAPEADSGLSGPEQIAASNRE